MIMTDGHQRVPAAATVETIQDILHVYDLVKRTGLPNFTGARIPLEHGLHISTWRQYANKLQSAGYSQANNTVDMLEFGFPMNYEGECIPMATYTHHSTALNYPEHMDNYIQTELAHGALKGPYAVCPFEWMVSPLLTCEKCRSAQRRVIMDLSYPWLLSE